MLCRNGVLALPEYGANFFPDFITPDLLMLNFVNLLNAHTLG